MTTLNNFTLGSNYTYTFGYDSRSRLTSVTSALTNASENYSYNSDGALLSKNRNGKSTSYTYLSGNHSLDKVTINSTDNVFSYNTKGSATKNDDVDTLVYNHDNMPVEVTNSTPNKYLYIYNADGQRIKKIKETDNSGEYYLDCCFKVVKNYMMFLRKV